MAEFFAEWMVAMFNKLYSNHAGQYTLSFHHPIHRSLSRANYPFRRGPVSKALSLGLLIDLCC